MANKPNNNRADRGKNRKAGNVSAKLTAAQERMLLARQYRLKPKTKEFIDELLDNKAITQTDAYRKIHPNASYNTAASAATNLLKKPSVIGYKDSAVGKAKRRIVSLVDSNNDNTALKAAIEIIDRNEGKAIQKSENVSKVIEVKLDLTGVRIGAHYVNSAQEPVLLPKP